MIQNLKKIFHTDKWWGKMIFVLLVYVVFWCIFYGSLSLIPEDFFVGYNNFGSWILIYVFAFVPILSLYLSFILKKKFLLKRAYFVNFLFLILGLVLFFYIDLLKSMSGWFSLS